MMSTDISRCLDPVLLAKDASITPDPWQAELLRERPKRALLCCARQSGKTTTALLLAMSVALYEPPALVLIVSPSLRQSTEAFRSFMVLYHKLEGMSELKAESATRAELANGSRVISLPGSERTIRGFAGARMIVLDEAARIEDDLIAALRPMMATVDGSLIALSTPAGRRGWFFEAWTGDDSWHRVRVPASECPRLSKEFLAEELRELGPLAFSEEYGLEFRNNLESVFNSELIARAFTGEVRPLWQ
jgi:Terminase large subunit, T4likevirus-type, N-terminal